MGSTTLEFDASLSRKTTQWLYMQSWTHVCLRGHLFRKTYFIQTFTHILLNLAGPIAKVLFLAPNLAVWCPVGWLDRCDHVQSVGTFSALPLINKNCSNHVKSQPATKTKWSDRTENTTPHKSQKLRVGNETEISFTCRRHVQIGSVFSYPMICSVTDHALLKHCHIW